MLLAAATVATSHGLNTLITKLLTSANKEKKEDLMQEVLSDMCVNKK